MCINVTPEKIIAVVEIDLRLGFWEELGIFGQSFYAELYHFQRMSARVHWQVTWLKCICSSCLTNCSSKELLNFFFLRRLSFVTT